MCRYIEVITKVITVRVSSVSEYPQEIIKLFAGQSPDGQKVMESVPAENMGEGRYRLLQSPAFARDLARGDKIVLAADGSPELEKRSGNLCIRVISREGLDNLEQQLTSKLEKLGGALDINTPRILVYSIHVSCGFDEIEKTLREAISGNDATWLYGNVYDPTDGETPLNWWQEFLKPE